MKGYFGPKFPGISGRYGLVSWRYIVKCFRVSWWGWGESQDSWGCCYSILKSQKQTLGTLSHGQSKIQYPHWKWTPSVQWARCHFLSGSAVGRNVGFLFWQFEKVMGVEPRSPRRGCGHSWQRNQGVFISTLESIVVPKSLAIVSGKTMPALCRSDLGSCRRISGVWPSKWPKSLRSQPLLTNGFRERPATLFAFSISANGVSLVHQTAIQ